MPVGACVTDLRRRTIAKFELRKPVKDISEADWCDYFLSANDIGIVDYCSGSVPDLVCWMNWQHPQIVYFVIRIYPDSAASLCHMRLLKISFLAHSSTTTFVVRRARLMVFAQPASQHVLLA